MFYDNFERLCESRGLSPSRCAMQAGLGRTTPAGWKKLGTIPKQDVLEKLAKVLGCNVHDFFINNSDNSTVCINSKNCGNTIYENDSEEEELLELFRSLPLRKQRLRFLVEAYDVVDKLKGQK